MILPALLITGGIVAVAALANREGGGDKAARARIDKLRMTALSNDDGTPALVFDAGMKAWLPPMAVNTIRKHSGLALFPKGPQQLGSLPRTAVPVPGMRPPKRGWTYLINPVNPKGKPHLLVVYRGLTYGVPKGPRTTPTVGRARMGKLWLQPGHWGPAAARGALMFEQNNPELPPKAWGIDTLGGRYRGGRAGLGYEYTPGWAMAGKTDSDVDADVLAYQWTPGWSR